MIASPSHKEVMKRYRAQLAQCADLEPPLTENEKKHILDACLSGGAIILRCRFVEMPTGVYILNGPIKVGSL